MSTIVLDTQRVQIPPWVTDLGSFRRWVYSDDFPENGRICFLGEVWVDMSKEQFSHNQAKGEISSGMTTFAKVSRAGRFFPDGYRLTNTDADLSTNPDGIFVLNESLDTGRVRLVEGLEGGYVELEGTPDMVLEVVSQSSVEKDTVTLRDLYWCAGIHEYWLVDVRGDLADFSILRHESKGYVVSRKQKGWLKTDVLGRQVRFTRDADAMGYPEFTFAIR